MQLIKLTDKERDVALATERIRSQLNESHRKQNELLSEIFVLKVCLIFSYTRLRDACSSDRAVYLLTKLSHLRVCSNNCAKLRNACRLRPG